MVIVEPKIKKVDNLIPFYGQLVKIKIVSNNICYGLPPFENEEVE